MKIINSPDRIQLEKYIHIDRRKSDPIYLQIVFQVINLIRKGTLPLHSKLSGTRQISEKLMLNRQTVVKALEELKTQGWLDSIPKVGNFVLNPEKEIPKKEVEKLDNTNSFTFKKSFIIDSPYESSNCRLTIDDGEPDYKLINLREISRFYTNALKRKNTACEILDQKSRGNSYFREQLTNYIGFSRGFQIKPQNIAVAQSKEMLVYTLSQLLIRQNDVVLVADYSYFFTNMIFQQAGAKIHTIPSDTDGINVEWITEHFKENEIRLIYINSRCQYPTTAQMTAERKERLRFLSQEFHFIIIEEDTEFEFQHEEVISTSLFGNSMIGNVIYLGSFARFLPTTFHTNFIIAPPQFIEEIEKYLAIIDPKGDVAKGQALAEMINEGNILRYQWKCGKFYKKKRNSFVKIISNNQNVNFNIPTSGLALWLVFNKQLSLSRLVDNCQKKDLFIPRICQYQNNQKTAIRIGFGSLNQSEMLEISEIISHSIER